MSYRVPVRAKFLLYFSSYFFFFPPDIFTLLFPFFFFLFFTVRSKVLPDKILFYFEASACSYYIGYDVFGRVNTFHFYLKKYFKIIKNISYNIQQMYIIYKSVELKWISFNEKKKRSQIQQDISSCWFFIAPTDSVFDRAIIKTNKGLVIRKILQSSPRVWSYSSQITRDCEGEDIVRV